ncbi:hypothetical protein KR222_002674 [Zaprionus bogoriensis]|nr:hypothetical protein KR222_002674 [Zaprionus bogoriensis]
MSGLLNEVQRILGELVSGKAPARNKAIEQLDQKLNSCKDALDAILGRKQELSWQNVFDAVKEAIFKHADELQDARVKTHKTLANKCYLYGNVVDKIIDHNLESKCRATGSPYIYIYKYLYNCICLPAVGRSKSGHFLAKSTIFKAFEEGIKRSTVVRHFGVNFLNMLDRGIYLSQHYTFELKVSEYSRILSYLFELNVGKDEFLRSKLLRCITTTVQLAKQRVQLHGDLVDYLPTLSSYAQEATTAERKTEIVRLYHIFLSVNYHHELCTRMQEILPRLCDFHNDDTFRDDTKNLFFESVLLSLHALYPKLRSHDFNTFQVPIHESWAQTLQKLKTIIHMEIRRNSTGRSKSAQLSSDKFSEHFLKMSALILYIVLWHLDASKPSHGEQTPSKRVRVDKLDSIVSLIEKQETSFNAIWFAIFAELLQLSDAIINAANYQQTLQLTLDVLLIYDNGRNLHHVRLCVTSLLAAEQQLLQAQAIPAEGFLSELWTQIAAHLISETRSTADVIAEKQLMLQALIRRHKLTPALCCTLLQSITSNEILRRNECIATIREIFIHAQHCGLDKASAEMEPIIGWAYASEKINATQMIHNIAAIEPQLLADTFSIGIINFLDERQQLEQQLPSTCAASEANLQLLQYKYNKQLICLDEQFQAQLRPSRATATEALPGAKNCLFQHNYELLMRMLNPGTTNEHTANAILKDLRGLHKLVCSMERLLHYKVFDGDNLTQCPLIKRIGLFLSHIEFQYKANQAASMDDSDLRDILQQQIAVLQLFNSNEILLQYLEKQPIEMLIEFMGALLKHNCRRKDAVEEVDHAALITQCYHILGCLCANSSYSSEAFRHISQNVNHKTRPADVLLITKLLCRCKSLSDECIVWLVDQLKNMLQQHYLDIDIASQVVEQLPGKQSRASHLKLLQLIKIILFPAVTFYFVYERKELLEDMLSALYCLLKVALKKSYPTQLAVKVVQCVAHVAQRCTSIFDSENFAVICKSVGQFLAMPTLEVRFAALATLTLFLNAGYCVADSDEDVLKRSELHMEFCEQLYECIDWQKLQTSGPDLVQNSHAVAIQTLLAFFAFSTFHQEIALQQLLTYCAKEQLNETDFCALASLVPGQQVTMQQLLLPYADVLLHQWSAQRLAVSKFPFFLCYNSKEAFLKAHASSIMAYTLLYGQPEDVTRCREIVDEKDSLVILGAYRAARASDCEESHCMDFRQHHENLQRNLQHLDMDVDNVNAAMLDAHTLYKCVELLLDRHELARLFGDTVSCIRAPAWYNLSAASLFKCLGKLMVECLALTFNPIDINVFPLQTGKNWSQNARLQPMCLLMLEQPLVLLELLDQLKSDCHSALLESGMLRSFFLYCSLADAILDAAKSLTDDPALINDRLLEVNCAYFVRDIWYFVCRMLLHNNCVRLHRAVLAFLQTLLGKCGGEQALNLSAHANELAKLMVAGVRNMETRQLKHTAAELLELFVAMHRRQQVDLEALLDEAGDCGEFLQPLRALVDPKLPKAIDLGVVDYIRAFLKPNRLERLHGLREYIAEHKDVLQSHEQLLFELISRLIRMVRESPKQEGSLAALKCLAEIGPLKMQHISYYFQTDFDADEQSAAEPAEQFLSIIMDTLERNLFHYNVSTQPALMQVALHVVNSKSGQQLSDQFPNLRLFCQRSRKACFLNSYDSMPGIDWLGILQSCEQLDYEPWLCAFMSRVFAACDWQGFDALAAKSFSFAKVALQPFIKLLLANKQTHLKSLCAMLDHFFERCTPRAEKCIYQEKRAIKRMLYMCECIRLVNNWWIPLKLCNVVQASNHCQAYFLSIMYLELWACSTSGTPDRTVLDDDNFQTCAKTAYESIGCLDAMPSFLNPLRSRVDYLSLENNLCGILLESDGLHSAANSQLCVDIMKSNGMLSFAHLQQRQQQQQQVDYEILWRLGQWDEQVDVQPRAAGNMELQFQRNHYMALKSISNREEENTLSAIGNAYDCVLDILRDISVECLQTVYKYMTWLGTLQQAEDFCQIQFSHQLSPAQINETFGKWQTELELSYGNFKCKEHILSHQIALFKMAGTRASRRIEQYYNRQSPVDTYLLKCIGECKAAGRLNLATKYIAVLRGLPNIKEPTKASPRISVLLEDADVNVRTGNYQIAKAILQDVVSNAEFKVCLQRVPALRLQGEFLLNCNAQSFGHVLEQNFQAGLTLLDQFKTRLPQVKKSYPDIFTWSTFEAFENANRKAAHAAIAKHADREYQQLHDYRHSQEYQMIADNIQQHRRLASSVDKKRTDRDQRIGALNMNRFANLDESQLQRIDDNLSEHLCTAVKHHIAYCQLDSGSSSATIYRIIALWFTNGQNAQLLQQLKADIGQVPSYKFICAVNQLAGRLSSKHAEFHRLLVELLVRCGQEHPQHTFYKLYPLVYAHMDGSNSNTQRAEIAKRIIAQICTVNPMLSSCSKQFECLFPALINFANTYLWYDPQGRPSSKNIPEKLKKLNALRMNSIQCPTLELPVQPNGEYNNIVSIERWKSEGIFLCSGLNAPVKLLCQCSDGVVRAQLIKGKDDLRQDAVMQQVFGIVNELLHSDAEFIERRLQLRTYKVTPLSTRSGILEWCSNTIPVGAYLVGDGTKGAHMKYRPNDWNNRKCREMSSAALKKTADVRKMIYAEICKHVKPVLHYFLLEKFPIPGVWFERRLAYVNSVATTSMVGYVLGLGDRHTQNILIDEQTAEVVHIDFGIAFEQGKVQTTPETVPFRLSRDFVAPMGVCGTNGVFTKSCEAIMHILRRYKSVFTTILEVLLYDPLFIWGVLSKEQTLQSSTEENKNLMAQRALLLVQYKLEGREPGLLDIASVEAQVQRLINEATLPNNLAMLFPGWDPYL